MFADNNGGERESPINLADELGVRADFGRNSYLDREGRLFACLGKDFGIAQFGRDGSLVFMPPDKPRNEAVAEDIRLDVD